ncbi:I78 family peptidase inhibitor [Aaestuariibius violaceus]|uniref:I78 family peptidase inhibitor n=1 Tax=Aestuariibius violaceus TaxID=3234132 RepID=UPI00345E371D
MKYALPIFLLALAACEPSPSVSEEPGGLDKLTPDTCGAADYESLVGSNIAAVTLPSSLNDRVIGPGDIVTQEYSPGRINFRVDENGVILSVTCG